MEIDTSNFELCLKRIAKAGGVGAREARQILEDVHARGEALKESGQADAYVKAAQELAERRKEAARLDRLDALRNAKVRAQLLAQVDAAGGIKSAETVLRSLLHGTNVGARDSVEARWRGVAAGWQAVLSNRLRRLGLEHAAITGELDRDIARELWAINAGEIRAATANNPARQIAEAIHPLIEEMRNRLNAAGARIGDARDFAASTLHDPRKLRAAAGSMRAPIDQAFEAWWKETEPLLAEKTFDEVTPKEGESMDAARERFGRSVFEALVSGVHMTEGPALTEKGMLPAGEGGYISPAFEGSANIARKLSQGRVLFWRDGASWHQYMQRYGLPTSLTGGIMATLDRGARRLALMEKLGTNPAGNLNLVIRRIEERYRSEVDAVKAFQSKIAGIRNVMAHLDGTANVPANEMAARISASIRTWEAMSDLGGVGITHFASIWPTVQAETVHHGVSRLETLGTMVRALLKGRGSEAQQEIAAQLGAFSHGLTRDMWARWQPDQPIAGRLSAMANTFMKYTGIHYVFDNTQAAVREMLANHLARNMGKGFDALDPRLSQMLGKYGIGAEEWELLRRVPDLLTDQGHAYLTPRDALRTDAGAVEQLVRQRGLVAADADDAAVARAVGRFQQDLSDKLYAYYGDASAHAVVTPGVRERAFLLGGSKAGTLAGEFARFFAQFKVWPLAAMNQAIGREIHMSLSRGQVAWNLGILIALGLPAGYMRMAVNDAALGHPLRNPLDPKTMLAALAQSGGLGIFGDFLFGDLMRSRFESGLVGTAGGPVASDLDSFINIYNGWLRGKMGWPDLAHFAVRHIPFANLVYLKGALDYLLWYHLYEAASPGWWERTNRRLEREQGRTMSGYVPGAGVPWTPWGIGQGQ